MNKKLTVECANIAQSKSAKLLFIS